MTTKTEVTKDKRIEEIPKLIIDLGVEVATHQDADAFIRTYTFNDAQLEAFSSTIAQQQVQEAVRIVDEVRNLMSPSHPNIDERISFYAACNEIQKRLYAITQPQDGEVVDKK